MEKGTMGAITKVINLAVDKAVERALFSGKQQWEKAPKDAYKSTETRLFAYTTLLDKLEFDRERLEELERGELRDRSTSVHFARHDHTGNRLSPEEIQDALIQNMNASIATTQYEIELVEAALKRIEHDEYYGVIYNRFVELKTDEEIAEEIPCDPSTVRRNRGRLIRKLAVFLYGAEAALEAPTGRLGR